MAAGRSQRAVRLAAAAVLAGAAALLFAGGGTGGPQPAGLLHLAAFTVSQNLDAGRRVRGHFDHLPAKEDFLHAHRDDRDGFPRAEYHKSDDDDALSADLSAAAKKVKLLSSREQAARKAAATRAAADLGSYDSAFSSGIDEYSKISRSIDEQSRKVFSRSLRPKKPPKPVYDPLGDDRKVWKKMGVDAGGVFGVPHEYVGWRATATSNPASLKHLPDYVKRAQAELGGGAVAMAANGWHSHPLVPSRRQAKAAADAESPAQPPSAAPAPAAAPSSPYDRAVGSYVPPPAASKKPARGRAAQAPRSKAAPDAAMDAQTLQSIVKAAVSKALKAREAAEAQQHPPSTPVSQQPTIVWATAVPVTTNSPKAVRMSAAAAAAPVAAAADFAAPSAPPAPARAPAAPSADAIAMVKKMAEKFEAARRQQQQWVVAADEGADEGVDARQALVRERSALLNEEAAGVWLMIRGVEGRVWVL